MLKRYKVTAKNVEYLMSNYIKALSIEDAKERFINRFNDGEVAVNDSQIQFQEVKREEVKDYANNKKDVATKVI